MNFQFNKFSGKWFIFASILIASFVLYQPGVLYASDGSGTNTGSLSTTLINSTGNTATFTYTASETMDSGGITITVPSTWSTPQGVAGTAGYTTATTTGTIGSVFDEADVVTGWTGSACSGGITEDISTKHSGTGAVKCVNSNESNNDVWYKSITAQDWSGYTTIGFWVRSDTAFSNNQLSFAYSTASSVGTGNSNIAEPGFGSALSANTWTYVSFPLTGTRTSVASYGFKIQNLAVKNATVWIDHLTIGAGSGTNILPTFSGNDIVVSAISLSNGQTITVTYGAGGGASGAVAPSAIETSTFTTKSKTVDSGTLTTIGTSPTISVLDHTAPTGGSVSYTNGYFTSASVALTVNDGTDPGSGINTSSRIVKRDSATLSAGSCGSYTGAFSTITTSGSYPNLTDSSVSSGNCYKYEYLVSDNSSNQATYISSNVAKIDTIAPSGGSVSYTNGYFTTASVPVTYDTGSDSVSGLSTGTGKITRDSATLSAGICGSYTGTFSDLHTGFSDSPYSDTSVTSGHCYMYKYLIQDNAGNQATYTSSNVAKVDTAKPTTSDDYTHDGSWVTTSQTITLTPSDAVSGVSYTKYCIDAVNTCDPTTGTTLNSPFQISMSTEGTRYLRYESTDNAGNIQNTVSKSVKIDTVIPSVTTGTDKTKSAIFSENATTSDATSGIATYQWSKQSGPGTITFGTATTEDTTITANTDGVYVIRLTITDNAGNSNNDEFTLTWDTSIVDNTPPTTSDDYGSKDGNWQNTNQTITLTPDDDVSGVASTKYCTDSSNTCDPTAGTTLDSPYQVIISTEGTTYFRYESTDNSNNVQATVSRTVKIDKTAPNNQNSVFTPSAFVQGGATVTIVSSGDSANTVWFAPSGTTSFSAGSSITTAGGTATSIAAPATEGTYKLYVIDQAGNISSASTATLTVDNTPPAVNAGGNKTEGAQYNQDATASDALSGIATYQWSKQSGPGTITFGTATTEDTTISADTDGSYVLRLTVTDNVGNSNYDEFTLTWDTSIPDTTDPTAAITYSINHAVKSGDSLIITATFSEPMADSPVPKIAISGANTLAASAMTKSSSTVYTYNFSVGSGNGTATLSLSNGTDIATNPITANPTSGATFTVDNIGPIISDVTFSPTNGVLKAGDTLTVTVTADSAGYTGGVITINGRSESAVDNGDGTYTVTYVVVGGDPDIAQNAQIPISIVLVDAAGNQSSAVTTSPNANNSPAINTTDNTKPAVTINQSNTQSDPTASLPISFDVAWSEVIDTDTFTTADITQNGTAGSGGITWSITDSGDHQNFTLTATSITGDGTVVPSIHAGQVSDLAANTNTVSSSTDNSVIYDTSTPDDTPPIISAVDTHSSASGASFHFDTDQNANTLTTSVEYGLTDAYGVNTLEDHPGGSGNHTIVIAGLVSCTTYYYQISTTDASLLETTYTGTFTTRNCAGDSDVDTQTGDDVNKDDGADLSLLTSDTGISVHVPPAFSNTNANFQIKKLIKSVALGALGLPNKYKNIGDYVYDLHALSDTVTAISNFDHSITVSVKYKSSEISNADSKTLKIFRNDGGPWIPLDDCVVNTNSKTVTCVTSGFSTFSLFGTTTSQGSIAIGSMPFVTNPIAVTPTLGIPGACSSKQIITQNLHAPARDGNYERYTGGIVKEVKILQAHLNRLGFTSGKEDGILGPITDGAIKRMQIYLGTKADGYVGPITRGLINNSCGVQS